MTYGIKTFDSSGNLQWSSLDAGAGVVVEVISIPAGMPMTRTYEDFAGFTVSVIVIVGRPESGAVVDTALGYPRVIIPAPAEDIKVMIAAR